MGKKKLGVKPNSRRGISRRIRAWYLEKMFKSDVTLDELATNCETAFGTMFRGKDIRHQLLGCCVSLYNHIEAMTEANRQDQVEAATKLLDRIRSEIPKARERFG